MKCETFFSNDGLFGRLTSSKELYHADLYGFLESDDSVSADLRNFLRVS